mmetsp:Transcript_85577/g.223305  ORF Transcript_85577/g.223305 Transcript_85577/m.223305 type:complete len:270 (-) Transcript_85577:2120-2929(-)
MLCRGLCPIAPGLLVADSLSVFSVCMGTWLPRVKPLTGLARGDADQPRGPLRAFPADAGLRPLRWPGRGGAKPWMPRHSLLSCVLSSCRRRSSSRARRSSSQRSSSILACCCEMTKSLPPPSRSESWRASLACASSSSASRFADMSRSALKAASALRLCALWCSLSSLTASSLARFHRASASVSSTDCASSRRRRYELSRLRSVMRLSQSPRLSRMRARQSARCVSRRCWCAASRPSLSPTHSAASRAACASRAAAAATFSAAPSISIL